MKKCCVNMSDLTLNTEHRCDLRPVGVQTWWVTFTPMVRLASKNVTWGDNALFAEMLGSVGTDKDGKGQIRRHGYDRGPCARTHV